MINKLAAFKACLFLSAALSLPAVSEQKVLNVAYKISPPFQYQDNNQQAVGIDIEMIKAILQHAGMSAKFQLYPWKRGLHHLKSGKIDIALSAGRTAERNQYAHFSSEVFSTGYNALFVHKKHISGLADIRLLSYFSDANFKLGYQLGFSYSDEFDALMVNRSFTRNLLKISDLNQAVKLTEAGRIDGFFANEVLGRQAINRIQNNEAIKMLFRLYTEQQAMTFLMFSRKSVDVTTVSAINESMKVLREKGVFSLIQEGYEY